VLTSWALFPLLLLALCAGWGLLAEAIVGISIPRVLLPGLGLCAIIAVGEASLVVGSTSAVALPLTVAGGAGGWAWAAARGRPGDPGETGGERWAALAGLVVFAAFGAPIVLSGQATLAGFIKLDDTATWLAITDQIAEHGRSLGHLAPSTYETTLAFTVGKGYPVGAMVPLAIGSRIMGADPAWLVAPYMAVLATLLALALWTLARPLVPEPWLRALIASIAAQSAILYGDVLWGGVKEVLAAAAVATGFGLAAAVRRGATLRLAIPPVIVAIALADALSIGGVVWLVPALALIGTRLWARLPSRSRRGVVAATAAILVAATPALALAGFVSPFRHAFTSDAQLGNLVAPLSPAHLAGIWPAGDFRLDPELAPLSAILIALVLVLAAAGVAFAVARRAFGIFLYVVGSVAIAVTTWFLGSPWIAAKGFAIAAACLPFAAAIAAARLRGRSGVGSAALLAAIAGGVLWSNALAYRDVNLAPRDQLAELETIGHLIAGQGPTLMTEYEPYGVRHFLREAAAEGASELRRRRVPLVGGGALRKGMSADTDRFQLGGLLVYRTLVLRRSPAQSRPPSPYRLIWRGDFYEAWQRPAGPRTRLIAHLGLGTAFDPGGVASCRAVRRLARKAGPRGELAAVRRAPVVVIRPPRTDHPRAWEWTGYPKSLLPATAGAIRASPRTRRPGTYEVWLRGSVRPEVDLQVDGRPVDDVRHELNHLGDYVLLGRVHLDRGDHEVAIDFQPADLHPGSGGSPTPVGPLVLSRQDLAGTRISRFGVAEARRLCGRRWDWVEALAPG
jgi:hypothetical protein